MKKVINIFIILCIIILALGLMKNVIAKVAIEQGVKGVTGLPLTMESLKVGIIDSRIHIQGLKIMNPESFEERIMVEMPEIFVDYDLPAFFKGLVHLEEVRVDLSLLSVLKNKQGELNLNALKPVQEQKVQKAKPAAEKDAEKAAPVKIQIDLLQVKVGQVIFKDQSLPVVPVAKTFKINLDERYENVTDPTKLVQALLYKILKNTTIGSLTDFDVSMFSDAASDMVSSGKELASQSIANAQKAVDSLKEVDLNKVKGATTGALDSSKDVASKTLEGTSEAVKDAAGSLKKATSGLMDAFKSEDSDSKM